jgi:hypothetical protein
VTSAVTLALLDVTSLVFFALPVTEDLLLPGRPEEGCESSDAEDKESEDDEDDVARRVLLLLRLNLRLGLLL